MEHRNCTSEVPSDHPRQPTLDDASAPATTGPALPIAAPLRQAAAEAVDVFPTWHGGKHGHRTIGLAGDAVAVQRWRPVLAAREAEVLECLDAQRLVDRFPVEVVLARLREPDNDGGADDGNAVMGDPTAFAEVMAYVRARRLLGLPSDGAVVDWMEAGLLQGQAAHVKARLAFHDGKPGSGERPPVHELDLHLGAAPAEVRGGRLAARRGAPTGVAGFSEEYRIETVGHWLGRMMDSKIDDKSRRERTATRDTCVRFGVRPATLRRWVEERRPSMLIAIGAEIHALVTEEMRQRSASGDTRSEAALQKLSLNTVLTRLARAPFFLDLNETTAAYTKFSAAAKKALDGSASKRAQAREVAPEDDYRTQIARTQEALRQRSAGC